MTATERDGAPVERLPGPSGAGTVVLDIGESQGALVVYADAGRDGVELEIRADGDDWTGRHVAVRRRDVQGASCCAAVFDRLAPAVYELRECRSDTPPRLRATVEAARVVEAWWPDEPGRVRAGLESAAIEARHGEGDAGVADAGPGRSARSL